MKKIITQKDEICGHCGFELPKGTICYSDEFEEIRCVDCYEDEFMGETYG
jgi:hypothetical protein